MDYLASFNVNLVFKITTQPDEQLSFKFETNTERVTCARLYQTQHDRIFYVFVKKSIFYSQLFLKTSLRYTHEHNILTRPVLWTKRTALM